MSSPLYSSTAPDGWNALPMETKQQFYSIASKGDWTAHEAFVHLVPEELRDDPEQVELFMDGGTVETQEWVYDQGRAGGHYETVEHTISDKDVSRIESGHNGGEYSTDNTIMEDASINRSRGADDMTEAELESTIESNSADVELIETSVSSTEVLADTSTSATESIVDVAIDALGPALTTIFVGRKVWQASRNCTTHEKVFYTYTASTGTLALCCTPVLGQLFMSGVGIYAIGSLGWKACKGLSRLANS